MDREKKQKDLLVGSLNAANKYTIGRGKMQKLSGIIITKNINPDKQKMPPKVSKMTLKKSLITLCYTAPHPRPTMLQNVKTPVIPSVRNVCLSDPRP